MMITWSELAIIGIVMSYLLTVLVYMLSYFINSEVLRSWSKLEIQNVFLTLILFASLSTLASYSFVVDYVNSGSQYISNTYNMMVGCQSTFISESNLISVLASISVNINPTIFNMQGTPAENRQPQQNLNSAEEHTDQGNSPGAPSFGLGISFAPFLQPLLNSVVNIQSYMFIPLGMIKLHQLIISFMVENGAKVLLPFGIFFRSFKFSRHAGNLLLALFMALYFILPAMYLFNKELLVYSMGLDETSTTCGTSNLFDDLAASIANKFADYGKILNPITGGEGKDISELVMDAANNLSYDSDSGLAVVFLRMGIEGMILPMFSIITSLGIAREFSHILGSEIDFSQLVRVV